MNRFQLLSCMIYVIIMLTTCSGNDDSPAVDCSNTDLAVTFESINPESCSVVNGIITATASGGTAPYTYALNAGIFGSNPIFTALSTGDYIVRVKDKNGCTVATNEIQLRIPGNTMEVMIATEPDTECVSNNGSITVTVSGGTEPYHYKIDNGAFGNESTFSSLSTGNHTVTVKDAAGCLFPKSVFINRGDTGISLSNEIQPIINASCAIPNCHNGAQEPNLSTLAGIRNHATAIKTQTQSGAMPKEGSITSSEKAEIACWVDDGAKDN